MQVQSRQQAHHLALDDRCRQELSRRCTARGREPYPELPLVVDMRRGPRALWVVYQNPKDRTVFERRLSPEPATARGKSDPQ